MKPLDPRLVRHARAARRYVVVTAILGLTTTSLVIAQAILIAAILAPAIQGTAKLSDLVGRIGMLSLVIAARTASTWAQERFAIRAASQTISELRESVLTHSVQLGPRWLATRGPDIATLTTRGLDALEPYLVRYLPQLLLAATVTPLGIVVVLGQDWISAAIIVGTIPLIPIFMILVGRLTQGTAERRLVVMQRLGAQVLDLLAGLPTLRAFGREIGPQKRVRALGNANRQATMSTLRVAFLSGMVLELLTTLSVAMVAVAIGMRLVYGKMDLEPGLAALILAPEIYLPLRQVGLHFHASTDGLAAAQEAFAILDEPAPPRGTRPCPPLKGSTITMDTVGTHAATANTLAPGGLTWSLPITSAGSIMALTGPSGSGKTTTTQLLLGLLQPDEGRITVEHADHLIPLQEIDLPSYWSQIAWVPQRPPITPGTLRTVVSGGRDLGDSVLEEAASLTGLSDVITQLPQGWDTPIGRSGYGLSVGQRQRVALTSTLLHPPEQVPLVIMDEPTAHLDAQSEQRIIDTVRRWRDQGRTVVVVAHRAALIGIADQVIPIRSHHKDPRDIVAH